MILEYVESKLGYVAKYIKLLPNTIFYKLRVRTKLAMNVIRAQPATQYLRQVSDFDEENLNARGEKFKDGSILFNHISEIETKILKRWMKNSRKIQWDYKNIVKRKGQLERLS